MSFGRLPSQPKALPMSDINVTPLVDVMLVLLVIFMVVILFKPQGLLGKKEERKV